MKAKMRMVGFLENNEKKYFKTIIVSRHTKSDKLDKQADRWMDSKWGNGSIDHMEMFWFEFDGKEFYDSQSFVNYLKNK